MRTKQGATAAGAAILIVLAVVGGCDDQNDGVVHRGGKHGSGAVARVGFGWRSTLEVTTSSWGFIPASSQPEGGPLPDPLAGIRAALEANMLPPHDVVRVADLVDQGLPTNPPPEAGAEQPRPQVLLTTTPWNDDTLLLWVAVPEVMMAAGQAVSVEFDPRNVTAFRPLGDAKALPRPDGDSGAAAMLYELISPREDPVRPDRRYAVLRVGRGQTPGSNGAPQPKLDMPVTAADFIDDIDDAPPAVRFAAAAAGFAELLRGDPAVRDLSCNDVISLAESADVPDPNGAHGRLIVLMRRAQPLIDLPQADAPPQDDAEK
jgi:hypothetical protein